ncbi:MAG: hypothetical protein M3541_05305, partial [Acidobacteriota bacterium]|nr:hypothetical protein [Acidobacteriota bacterium]
MLAALIGVVQLHTIDAFGVERIRTTVEVWRVIPPRLPQIGGPTLVPLLYSGALAVMIAGWLALPWLGASVRDDEALGVTRVATAARWLAAVLERSPAAGAGHTVCTAITLAIVAYVAWQLGAFGPATLFGVPDTFASFDHPFHAARAETLRLSIREGESLRWVANHQGGYPAEFYPFGFAAFEVLLWGLALGQLAMPGIHKIAVIILFLAPVLVFRAMARRDGWPPTVALAAFALHVAVPGGTWHGGYSELVYMGLVANVSAALAVLASMATAADAFASGRRRSVALAGVFAAAAIWCNPRSAFGLAVCVGAAWLIAVWRSPEGVRRAIPQLVAIAFIAVLLAAPELVSLVRYRELYYFVRFTSYASSVEYLRASIDAVSVPGFALAILGVVTAALVARQRYITSTTGLALLGYSVLTLLFSFGAPGLVQQLEATRLMPVQRLLTVYLAAVGLHALGGALAARTGVR